MQQHCKQPMQKKRLRWHVPRVPVAVSPGNGGDRAPVSPNVATAKQTWQETHPWVSPAARPRAPPAEHVGDDRIPATAPKVHLVTPQETVLVVLAEALFLAVLPPPAAPKWQVDAGALLRPAAREQWPEQALPPRKVAQPPGAALRPISSALRRVGLHRAATVQHRFPSGVVPGNRSRFFINDQHIGQRLIHSCILGLRQ